MSPAIVIDSDAIHGSPILPDLSDEEFGEEIVALIAAYTNTQLFAGGKPEGGNEMSSRKPGNRRQGAHQDRRR